jgi:hypothetical protein
MSACNICGHSPCLTPAFCNESRAADARNRKRKPDEHLVFLRRLMSDDISLERAWYEINRAAHERSGESPETTYQAVLYQLRTDGLSQLSKANCQQRLADLSPTQLKSLMAVLQHRRSQYPNVCDALLTTLAEIYDARASNEQ